MESDGLRFCWNGTSRIKRWWRFTGCSRKGSRATLLSLVKAPRSRRWIRAAGTTKADRGGLDVRVTVGGAAIEPGDIVVLDADGAVVVERARAAEVLEASEARQAKEEAMLPRLRAGELTADLHGLRPRSG